MAENVGTTGEGKSQKKPVYIPISFVHLAVGQGIYYLIMGLWPVFSIISFVAVTGPKTDTWLVRTVGLLIAVIGTVLLITGIRRRLAPETPVLAIGSAASLAAIEIFYMATGVISLVYLIDAFLEIIIIGLWTAVLLRRRGSTV